MFDSIVVGLGAMGSATLFELAKRGLKVLGLEQFTSPNNSGSTHGESRIIRQAYFKGTFYVPLILRAYKLWNELEQLSGQQLFTKTGGLFVGEENSEVVKGSIRSADQYNLPHEILSGKDIRKRFPPILVPDNFKGLFENAAGVLSPEKCVTAFRSLATSNGANIHDNEEVIGWKASDSHVEVHTTKSSYKTRSLVLVPGAWLPQLTNGFDLPLTVQRLTLFWFEPVGGMAPFQPDRFPIYICKTPENLEFYGFPAMDKESSDVKVAFHNISLPTDPNAVNRTVSPDEVDTMREALEKYLPQLNGPLKRTATCLYTTTPDEHFIIDRHPSSKRVVLASCCSGHGFKFSSAIGEALACLAMDEMPPIDMAPFKLNRFQKS
jgi:sarcosine oxidase